METVVTKPRVLVVEDDAIMRQLISMHLRHNGYDVAEAGDAESVLNAQHSSSYDLVLADIHLPGQSGVEMARQLRLAKGSAPVVFVTGDADEKLARTALGEGAAGYLLKPFEFFELDALMGTVLQKVSEAARTMGRTGGRDLSQTMAERRAFATWRAAIQRPEQVVVRKGRTTRRSLPFGLKAVAAVGCSVVLSWLIGSAVLTGAPSTRSSSLDTTATTSAPAPVFLPIVVESR
jgi:DNA-binding response OmpR family regulator